MSTNDEDVSINYFGQQSLKLCIAAKLKIFNGQTRVDLQGHFTNFGFQGCSTVDLVLASESLLKSSLIQYLSVQDLNLLSDQKPILLKISNNNLLEITKNPTNYILEDRPLKSHWDNSLKKSNEKHLAEKSNHFLGIMIMLAATAEKHLYTHCG